MIKLTMSILISLTLLGGGVGLIAQEAKPGDALYPFKIMINEKIAGLFTIGYTAEVDYQVDLLEERLAEIDELVAAGKLTGEQAVAARAGVIAQIEKTTATITNAQKGTLTAAQKASLSAALSRLKVTLTAYRATLGNLDAVVEKATLNVRGKSKGKSTATALTEIADAVEVIAEEVLEEEIVVEVEDDTTAEESEANEDDTTSTEEDVDDESSSEETSDDSTTIESETEVDTEIDVDVQTGTSTEEIVI